MTSETGHYLIYYSSAEVTEGEDAYNYLSYILFGAFSGHSYWLSHSSATNKLLIDPQPLRFCSPSAKTT